MAKKRTVREIGQERLTEAFHNWNKDNAKNPEGFLKTDDSEECAKSQAETLTEYLDKIPFKE